MALSDTSIRNAKPTEKAYKLYDSGGLFIQITTNGGVIPPLLIAAKSRN